MNTYARTDYVNMYTRTNVEMNDHWFTLGGYFADQEKGFYSEAKPSRAMPYKNQFQNAITYEVSRTEMTYFRSVYGIMSLLSEMGGLMFFLMQACLLCLTAFYCFSSYQFVMADTFYSRRQVGKDGPFVKGTGKKVDNRNDTQWNCCKSTFLNCRTFLPGCLCCCMGPSRS